MRGMGREVKDKRKGRKELDRKQMEFRGDLTKKKTNRIDAIDVSELSDPFSVCAFEILVKWIIVNQKFKRRC
jgi:hypothetical protein